MTIPTPYQCFLTVLRGGKGVPYGGCSRPDGEINHGFRPLKNRVDEVASIPETAADPALGDCLRLLNAGQTSVFTVGCVSSPICEENAGHRMSGYVEFSINDREMVGDAINYFQLFWHFVQSLQHQGFNERVTTSWELLGATFLDASSCNGMTCSVVINTHFHATAEEAYVCWQKTLQTLSMFLASVPASSLNRIY